MKALSILQPWAWLILHAGKDIENRTWPTRFRGEVLIHAGKTYSKRDYAEDAIDLSKQYGIIYPRREEMIGGIVGIATITDCVSTSNSRWFNGPYGLVLQNARPVSFVPLRGELGFFEVDWPR